MLAAAILAAGVAACGGSDKAGVADATARSATAEPTSATAAATSATAAVPSGWVAFDYGAIKGSAPEVWQNAVLSADEYLALAKEGLNETTISSKSKAALSNVKADQLSDSVLILLLEQDGFPNINVQPCFPNVPSVSASDGEAAAAAIAKSFGASAIVAGTVTVKGKDFALLKEDVFPQHDTYQVVFGPESCVSIATLTTDKGDSEAVDDFKEFLGVIRIGD